MGKGRPRGTTIFSLSRPANPPPVPTAVSFFAPSQKQAAASVELVPAAAAVSSLPGMTGKQGERWAKAVFDKMEASKLREALPEYFLDLGLDLYGTFTYAPRPTRHGKRVRPKGGWARKCLILALHDMNRAIWGRWWHKRRWGIFGVICWEKHKDGHPHAHALLGGLPAHIPVDHMQDWFSKRVGWCVVKRITPADRRVAQYVSKYVTKDASGDAWEFYGHLTGRSRIAREELGSLI